METPGTDFKITLNKYSMKKRGENFSRELKILKKKEMDLRAKKLKPLKLLTQCMA